jgi:hypothetical protein|tara:strand:- start:18237 stop:19259 length:1023 start_codon:yes stop_codon:yes gene_type:complete
MLDFLRYKDIKDFQEEKYLEEKLIVYQGGKKYGQIVFLAGGAGSGKGFAIKNFMEGEKFKIRDVDEYKRLVLKISQQKGKYPELRNLDLRNSKDVLTLHMFVKKLGLKAKSLSALIKNVRPTVLPNIMFDITGSEHEDYDNVLPQLLDVGYDPRNIHVTWILTDYAIAVKNNKKRSRVVADEILLGTHAGAAKTMFDLITVALPKAIDGQINIIFNNPSQTIPFINKETGEPIRPVQRDDDGNVKVDSDGIPLRHDNVVIQDFNYLRLKREGRPMIPHEDAMEMVLSWIKTSAPKVMSLNHIFGDTRGEIIADKPHRSKEDLENMGVGRRMKEKLLNQKK